MASLIRRGRAGVHHSQGSLDHGCVATDGRAPRLVGAARPLRPRARARRDGHRRAAAAQQLVLRALRHYRAPLRVLDLHGNCLLPPVGDEIADPQLWLQSTPETDDFNEWCDTTLAALAEVCNLLETPGNKLTRLVLCHAVECPHPDTPPARRSAGTVMEALRNLAVRRLCRARVWLHTRERRTARPSATAAELYHPIPEAQRVGHATAPAARRGGRPHLRQGRRASDGRGARVRAAHGRAGTAGALDEP